MKEPRTIKLARPAIPEEGIRLTAKILRSGNLVQGEYVELFERHLADYLGVRYVVAVSSGTAALHLGLKALGLGEKDRVILPAFTFPATANVVENLGAVPVLTDIRLSDFCMAPGFKKGGPGKRVKAILPVHEFGQTADMEEVSAAAERYGIPVLEDAACALGAEWAGRKAGTLGKLACFSFHPRKTITTGEGGAVVTDDRAIANRVRSLRNHGIVRKARGADFTQAGLNYRMTDFQAALGIAQLPLLEKRLEARRAAAQEYEKRLLLIDWIRTPREEERRKHTYQTYHVLVDRSVSRDRLIDHLRSRGIETNFGAYAVHCLTYYRKKYGFKEKDYPNAAAAFRRGLALPIGDHVRMSDIRAIAEALSEFRP